MASKCQVWLVVLFCRNDSSMCALHWCSLRVTTILMEVHVVQLKRSKRLAAGSESAKGSREKGTEKGAICVVACSSMF